jgi:ABC-type proline/glycine betaine transport system substrate-binding protein
MFMHVFIPGVVLTVGAAFAELGDFVDEASAPRVSTVQPVNPNWASLAFASALAAVLSRQLELSPLT